MRATTTRSGRGGDRREVFEPIDGLSGFPRLGLNQVWGEALGIPLGTNRTPIPDPLPEDRPNLIEFHLAGLPIRDEVPTPFPYGAPIRVAVDAPLSGPLIGRLVYLLRGSFNAKLTVFLDGDENSFNGSDIVIQTSLPPTGDRPAVVELDLVQLRNRALPGVYRVGAVLESGGFVRECYAAERLQRLNEGGRLSPILRWGVPGGQGPGGITRPLLEVQAATQGVHVVESSPDLEVWTPVWQGILDVWVPGVRRVLEGLELGSGDAGIPRFYRVRVP